MFTLKKTLLTTALLSLITIANFSIAHETNAVKAPAVEGSLKLVMQGLLVDTQQLTSAMLREDFASIEKFAKKIAEHPKPSVETRTKLMKAMGAEMVKFKSKDTVVHDAAVNMVKNAQQKNMELIAVDFNTMIGGCLSCHSEFKSRVSSILN